MTQDDVIKITRALGICELTSKPKQAIHYSLTIHEMLDAFKLVAEAEREACAKVCDAGLPIATSLSALDDMEMWGEKFAAAIRARSGDKE